MGIKNLPLDWRVSFSVEWHNACIPFLAARKEVEKEKQLRHVNLLAYKNARWRRRVRERGYTHKTRFEHVTSSSGIYF